MIIPKEIKQKPFEYLILVSNFIIGTFLYFLIDNNQIRRAIVYTVGLIYFGWSLYHHHKRGDLQFSIIVEYLLIIILGIVFISGTLF